MSDDSDSDYIPDSKKNTKYNNNFNKYIDENVEESVEESEEESEEDSDEDSDEESEEDSEEDSDEDSDNGSSSNNITFIINNTKSISPLFSSGIKKRKKPSSDKKSQNKKYKNLTKKYNSDEKNHFESLSDEKKEETYTIEKELENSGYNGIEPLRFKILNLDISNTVKSILLSKLEQFNKMSTGSGEYCKLSNWFNTFSKIPIGRYHKQNIMENNIATYLQNIKKSFDNNIFGHEETKEQIIRILAQWISNPNSNGYVIGIQGSPGVGKTKLIKDGICKAIGFPMSFISLGGISDSSYLNGHNFTYEGSTYGKIVESLIKANVMNPVFLFDELDKISETVKGDEIINTLIHITDPVQNDKYTDKYFEEIDLDLSKSLIIFTYNNEMAINPILRDRMITIKISGYNASDKLTLCRDYILPELLPQYNMKPGDVLFSDSLLKTIIEIHGKEEGMRNLKRVLNDLLSWINMMKYIPTDGIVVNFPFQVSQEFYNKYSKKNECQPSMAMLSMYT